MTQCAKSELARLAARIHAPLPPQMLTPYALAMRRTTSALGQMTFGTRRSNIMLFLTTAACSSPLISGCTDSDDGGGDDTGGARSVGGVTSRAGASNRGGSLAMGGSSNRGGASSGGVNSVAGAMSSGGSTPMTGGATSNAGTSSGGLGAMGGAIASGGANNHAGAINAAGRSATGGVRNTGGTTASGGRATGGMSNVTAGTSNRGGIGNVAGATNPGTGGRPQGGNTGVGGTTFRGGAAGIAGTPMAAGGGAGASTSANAGSGGVAGSTSTQPSTCPSPTGAEMTEASVPPGYCAWTFAEGLSSPRGIVADAQGQLVLIEAGSTGAVTLLWDANGDRINQASERLRIATVSGLNHGIAIYGGHLYASTPSTVYRWPYNGSHNALANRETVLTGMPDTGNHVTRTLVFDTAGNLYINIGSASNLDANSDRARVVRLDAARVSAGNAAYTDVTVQADGTRNEIALRFDSRGRLWGVENGSDDLNRTDLGGDIHNENPAEELNLLNEPGSFYGYPYCWSEGNLPTYGQGKGTQWAYPSVMNDGTHTDAWCRNPANVNGPALSLPAHTAPLDILFYSGAAFPSDMTGNAIITYHGSWNRTPATGYKVVVAEFGNDGMPTGTVTSLLESAGAGDTGDGWAHRPVGLAMGASGELYVTSDADGRVMVVSHD
ncbi:MAG TPA: PQQ-dependent sugar dehydrogenase [Polyangiaceae bacterium]